MKLHELYSPKGARRKKKRRGRGSGSGHGKTSCRGHKGLKSRTGPGLRPGFEGGQMPLYRRIPKRGFGGKRSDVFQVVNLASLDIFDGANPVTPEELKKSGLIKSTERPVKILGTGEIKKSIDVKAHAFSKSAVSKIKKAGGKAEEIKTSAASASKSI